MKNEVLLEVKGLKKEFGNIKAVNGIDFRVYKGQTLGIVGESGCGKSTTGRMLVRLIEPTEGKILFNGENISSFNKKKLHNLRKEVQMIFQDTLSTLNPKMRVKEILSEPLIVHKMVNSKEKFQEEIEKVLKLVKLDKEILNKYPEELKIFERQLVGIARAIILKPKLIICDEPISSLDLSLQGQILNLLKDLQVKYQISYIFITHNLSVVRFFCDEVAVMYFGKIVEKSEVNELFNNPQHSYTLHLLKAIPTLNSNKSVMKK